MEKWSPSSNPKKALKLPQTITLNFEVGEWIKEIQYEANNYLYPKYFQVGHTPNIFPLKAIVAKEWHPKKTLENNSSELEDGEIAQGTNDHAMMAKNNPMIIENPSILLVEHVQLVMDRSQSQNEE